MRLTRARLAAGAAALACLLGPTGAALADRPDDWQSPDRAPSSRDERSGQAPGQDGGTPVPPGEEAPPEAFVPAPPPQLEPPPREPRRPRREEPRRRSRAGRQAPPARRNEAPPEQVAAPRDGGDDQAQAEPEASAEPGRRTDPGCERELRRGEELLTLDDLCEGEEGRGSERPPAARAASAAGTLGNVAMLGALGFITAIGLRILARRTRDPR